MSNTYNIYCDESCHLEHDREKAMVLGAIWCSLEKTREIAQRLREIKARHGLSPDFEVKWTKVSPAKADFYGALIDYFFDDDDLHYRCLVVPDKTKLRHEDFGQDHDTWYYKMYFQLLGVLLSPESRYRIYIDIKDTCGSKKIQSLREVLCNSHYDFDRKIVERIQTVSSDNVEQLQLCDLLTGAIGYANRGLTSSPTKLTLIERIRKRSGLLLTKSTLLKAKKVNVFCWSPGGPQ